MAREAASGEMPEPELREDDVLVQVHAAGVNPLDSKIRNGEFKLLLPYRLPLILGNEAAGVVLRVGSRVQRFKPGDEVYARPDKDRIGTFAELIAIDEADVALKPTLSHGGSDLDPVGRADGLAGTRRAGETRPRAEGPDPRGLRRRWNDRDPARQASGRDRRDDHEHRERRWVKSLGADVVVDYKKDDFATVLSDYDLVLDSLGGETLEKSLTVVKPGGLVIGIGGPPDPAFAQELETPWVVRMAITAA